MQAMYVYMNASHVGPMYECNIYMHAMFLKLHAMYVYMNASHIYMTVIYVATQAATVVFPSFKVAKIINISPKVAIISARNI